MTVKVIKEKYVALSNLKFKLVINKLNIKNKTIKEYLMTLCNFEDITRSRITSKVIFCKVKILIFSVK